MRVIPLTHSTLVLLFVRADLLVAADVLRGGRKRAETSQSNQLDFYTDRDDSAGEIMPSEHTAGELARSLMMMPAGNTPGPKKTKRESG